MLRTTSVLICVAQGAAAEVPKVAVDIAPLHSIVSAVMGDLGQPDLIVAPGASPHGYSMRPSEARALEQADVVFWMGPKLGQWMSGPMASLAGDAVTVDLLAHPDTELLHVRQGATFAPHDHDHDGGHGDEAHKEEHDHDAHEGEHEHVEEHGHEGEHEHEEHGHEEEHGHDDAHDHEEEHAHEDHDEHAHDDHDDHGAGAIDPHAWLSPDNAVTWAGVIADTLSKFDADNADTYRANAASFGSDINGLVAELQAELDPVKGRPFIVFHDAYHYFEHRFDIEAVGAVSPTDAAAPSAARVADLQSEIASLNAVCALSEPQFNDGILNALGDVRLGVVDPLGATLTPGADLYPQVLRNMAASLSKCLK